MTRPLLLALVGALSCASDPGTRLDEAADGGADRIRAYQVRQAELEARHEREKTRLQARHEAEDARLEAGLIQGLLASAEDVRAAQAELKAQRRVFRARAKARVEKIDAQLEQLDGISPPSPAATALLADLHARRDQLTMQIAALDALADESWFPAKRDIDQQLSAIERVLQ